MPIQPIEPPRPLGRGGGRPPSTRVLLIVLAVVVYAMLVIFRSQAR